jgi:hypothetical protein
VDKVSILFSCQVKYLENRSNDLYEFVEEDLQSNEYEFTSLIYDLCYKIALDERGTFVLTIDGIELIKYLSPVLENMLEDLPYVIIGISKGDLTNHKCVLDYEINDAALFFSPNIENDGVLIRYFPDDGTPDVEVEVSLNDLGNMTYQLITEFSNFIERSANRICNHKLFQDWLDSELVKPILTTYQK